jgi:hypothetical protein
VHVDANATATIAALADGMYDNANLPLVNRTRTDLVLIVAGQQPVLEVRPLHPGARTSPSDSKILSPKDTIALCL